MMLRVKSNLESVLKVVFHVHKVYFNPEVAVKYLLVREMRMYEYYLKVLLGNLEKEVKVFF